MGTSLTEVLMSIAIGLLILAGVVAGLQKAMEGNNIADAMQGVYLLRTNVESMYSGSAYTDLTNAQILQGELAPKQFTRNGTLRSAWGVIDVAPTGSGDSQFTISLANLSRAACQQLGRISSDSWGSVAVNGTEVLDGGAVDVQALLTGCNAGNTNELVFTTP
jgi:hypothetical protein